MGQWGRVTYDNQFCYNIRATSSNKSLAMSYVPRYRPCVKALCVIMTFSMNIASVIIVFHENVVFTKSMIFYCFAIGV
jgi:hypothetical protein